MTTAMDDSAPTTRIRARARSCAKAVRDVAVYAALIGVVLAWWVGVALGGMIVLAGIGTLDIVLLCVAVPGLAVWLALGAWWTDGGSPW